MKQINFFLALFVIAITNSYSQDYQINFTASGESTSIDSIIVQNVTQGTSLTINGDDILHLSSGTGINTVKISNSNLRVYPNPIITVGNIEFYSNNVEKGEIKIFDLSGKLVKNKVINIEKGLNTIKISGLKYGVYTVNIISSTEMFSAKIVSNSNDNNIKISETENISNDAVKPYLKSVYSLVNMNYNTNDVLLITSISGNNSTIMSLVPTQSQTFNSVFSACQDFDNNNYMVTTIGSQTWMAENLKSIHYADGTEITEITSIADWDTLTNSAAYCWFNFDISNKDIYGALYNFVTAARQDTGAGVQGVCPDGWHLPTDEEWKQLEIELGMSVSEADNNEYRGTNEGSKLANGSWYTYSGALIADSEFGTSSFMAKPNGGIFKNFADPTYFYGVGEYAIWWSSTSPNVNISSIYRAIIYTDTKVRRAEELNESGMGVRCVMD